MSSIVHFSELCHFTPKQIEATKAADSHQFVLFGGARGPGKSYWLRWYVLRYLLLLAQTKKIAGLALLACEDYPTLVGRQISKIAVEFPQWLGELKETKERGLGFHIKPEYGGGSILLRNLDAPERYRGFEFAIVAIDELAHNRENVFNEIRGALRWPGVQKPRFIATSNPAPNWVRKYWIERNFPKHLESLAHEFVFIAGNPRDNPHLPDSYWESLLTLPDNLRKAWLEGDWYVGVEGLVYDEFSSENVCPDEPDSNLPIELAIDDGYIDPRAILFIQRQPDKILVFDEIYHTRHLEEESVAEILKRCQERNWPKPEIAVVSHEAAALRARLRMVDIPARSWLQARAGGNASTRLQAIQVTRSLIRDAKGRRIIRIHPRCQNLLNEITSGYRYPNGSSPSDTKPLDENDHACQALESWIWLRVGNRYHDSSFVFDDANTQE